MQSRITSNTQLKIALGVQQNLPTAAIQCRREARRMQTMA